MYETLRLVYIDGKLVAPGQIVQISDEDAALLIEHGYIRHAVYQVAIQAPDAVIAQKIQAETEQRIREEVALAITEQAKSEAASKAAEQAKIEGIRAESFLASNRKKGLVAPVEAN